MVSGAKRMSSHVFDPRIGLEISKCVQEVRGCVIKGISFNRLFVDHGLVFCVLGPGIGPEPRRTCDVQLSACHQVFSTQGQTSPTFWQQFL